MVRLGDSTSDAVCEPPPLSHSTGFVFTTASTMRGAVSAVSNSTLSVGTSVSKDVDSPAARSPPPTDSGVKLGMTVKYCTF